MSHYHKKGFRKVDKRDNEQLAIVIEIYGGGRMGVKGEDGITYLGVIRGKIRKRVWIRIGDVAIIQPWEFETAKKDKKPKAYILWRYTKTEVANLVRKKQINEEFLDEINNI